jgi:hypothetical protein
MVDCDDYECRTGKTTRGKCAKTETGRECFDGM